jgi:hypothetical protein
LQIVSALKVISNEINRLSPLARPMISGIQLPVISVPPQEGK